MLLTLLQRLGALAASTAVIAALAGPALAQPDPEQGFGYNVQTLVRATSSSKPPAFSPDQWPTYLGLMASDGIRVARTDVNWRSEEPTAPSGGTHHYDWTVTDQLAGAFAAQGVRWDAVLQGSPSWAGIQPSNRWSAPTADHDGDFAAFAAAFAARYGSGGAFWAEHPELPALPVTRFEVWNEPNVPDHWGGTPDPAAYAGLYAATAPAIKAAQPAAEVLVGGIVWNDDVNYLDAFFAALPAGVPMDGLGSHPYAPTVFALETNVVRVRSALDRLGRTTLPLEINELGWPAAYDRAPAAHAVDGPVSDLSRSGTMGLAIDALAASTCDVGSLVVYDLVEPEDDPVHVESLMGLYRPGGATTLTSKAFAAAVARYRSGAAHPPAPVPVCGARGAATTRLLPLELAATRDAAGCATATVSYQGAPLEEARVVAHDGHGSVATTDASGQARVCPRSAAGRRRLRVTADVANVAGSGTLDCTRSCRPIGPAAVCSLQNAVVPAHARIAAALARGVLVRTHACVPELGGAVRLRAVLLLGGHVAGTGTAALAPGGAATLRVRLGAAGRRALRAGRRVSATLQLRATEGPTAGTITRKVVLR